MTKLKRILCLLLVFACVLSCVPVAGVLAAAELPADFFLTQTQSGTCTLCSAAMLLRSRLYHSGNDSWRSVTENGIRSTAWVEGAGLRWKFTYSVDGSSLSVDHGYLSGVSVAQLKQLLDQHPEGIVLYCGDLPHAVFLIGYSGDTFYCAETVKGYSGKKISLAASWLGKSYGSQAGVLKNVTAYWYVTDHTIKQDSCTCSTAYAGTYVCTTESSNLLIRGGHGTSYSTIGSIPSGATVKVTKASGNEAGDWAHVEYDGISGYASMRYLALKEDLTLAVSQDQVVLSLDQVPSKTVQVWTEGSYDDPVLIEWTKSGPGIDCTWGDWVAGKLPLTVKANAAGAYSVSLCVKDQESQKVLDQKRLTVTVSEKSYSISYDANGGSSAPGMQIKLHGHGLSLCKEVPIRLGYTFLGWSTFEGATNPTYRPGQSFTADEDTVLYAVWKEAEELPSYLTEQISTAAIGFDGGHQSYRFTPNRTGVYGLYSTAPGATVVLYGPDGAQLAAAGSASGTGFSITRELESGKVYQIRVSYPNSFGALDFSLRRSGPVILGQSANVAVASGKTARVTLTASGSGLRYEWYYANAGSDTFRMTSSFTTSSYYVSMDKERDGRRVYCIVTDKYGDKVRSDTVTLSIRNTLKITTQPVSVAVASGKTAKVTVGVSGDGLTYSWYYANKGDSSFKKTDSFDGRSYAVSMNGSRDGRRVYCVITDKYGRTVRTDTVTLSMKTALKIKTQPISVKVGKGETAKVTVSVTGEGLRYEWYYANKGSTKFVKTDSFTTGSYYISMSDARDGRQVYCVITDRYGESVKTKTVTLSMERAVKITSQPVSVTVRKGEMAKVTVNATGDGLRYGWYYAAAGSDRFTKTSSFTTNSYYITMDASRDGRQVYCVIWDKYGNQIRTDTVTLDMA